MASVAELYIAERPEVREINKMPFAHWLALLNDSSISPGEAAEVVGRFSLVLSRE
ncbi:hypothetical protein ES703_110110 [subsurface metagenome]